jgi:hypothetical protein
MIAHKLSKVFITMRKDQHQAQGGGVIEEFFLVLALEAAHK